MKERFLPIILSSVFTAALISVPCVHAADGREPAKEHAIGHEEKGDAKAPKKDDNSKGKAKEGSGAGTAKSSGSSGKSGESSGKSGESSGKNGESSGKSNESSESEKKEKYIVKGDVNGDGKLDIDDIILFQSWLLGDRNAELENRKAADLYGDGKLDVFDLIIMRGLFLENADESDYAPPISVLNPSMPSTGTNRVLMFAVDFPDCQFETDNIAERMQKMCFGSENTSSSYYPFESVSAYFERSSYGRMHLNGDVYRYTAKNKIDYYSADSGRTLADEVMSAFEGKLDLQTYDVNSDGVLDSMVMAFPEKAGEIDKDKDKVPDWWSFSVQNYDYGKYDDIKIGTFCVITNSISDRAGFNNKLAHELCHAMGLPDYYKYSKDSSGDSQGMTGNAGNELMDEGNGDLSAFSKLMLGWLRDDEIQIYTGGDQTFSIGSVQQEPSCIIIPRRSDSGFLSEYFLIEYITGEANNAAYFTNGKADRLFQRSGGIRILHCQAEVSEYSGRTELTYYNFGQNYDKSDNKQRVLRLVNEGGYFYPGVKGVYYNDSIDSDIAGFNWYDKNGDLTVDTGLRIKISGPEPGPDYSADMSSSSSGSINDAAFLNGSTYSVRIMEKDS